MLGRRIADPHAVESAQPLTEALGLLPLETEFRSVKRTQKVEARVAQGGFLFSELPASMRVPGYFIHAGITAAEGAALFDVEELGRTQRDGASDATGYVMGSMVHGLFEHDGLRHAVLSKLRKARGLSAVEGARWDREGDYDKLAQSIADNCDTGLLDKLAIG